MAMQPAVLKSKLKQTIYNGLKKEFGKDIAQGTQYTGVADPMWDKLAEAISGIAMDIITEIQSNAEVSAGIPTAGGPASQATVAPGKIT